MGRNAVVIDKVQTSIMDNRPLIIWEIADEVGIRRGFPKHDFNRGFCHAKSDGKFVPKLRVKLTLENLKGEKHRKVLWRNIW
jgi:hypothetical protein